MKPMSVRPSSAAAVTRTIESASWLTASAPMPCVAKAPDRGTLVTAGRSQPARRDGAERWRQTKDNGRADRDAADKHQHPGIRCKHQGKFP